MAVYDYGMGGVWAIIIAKSAEEITKKYPILIVHDRKPEWMPEGEYNDIRDECLFDIDDDPAKWLKLAMKSG